LQEAEVEDLDDAGVIERGERGELGLEADRLLRIGQLVAKDLDRFVALVRGKAVASHRKHGKR